MSKLLDVTDRGCFCYICLSRNEVLIAYKETGVLYRMTYTLNQFSVYDPQFQKTSI